MATVTDDNQRATQARERGNEFYRKGAFGRAIQAYEEAARLAPSDPSPMSNLSAAHFEAGQFCESIATAERALGLLIGQPKAEALRQRLLVRSAEAHLHKTDLDRAGELLTKLEPSKDLDDLQHALRDSEAYNEASVKPSPLRERVLQLPRLRPSIQDEPDYFGPGHDDAESQFTPALAKSSADASVCALMFCGIGDARHLFLTVQQFAKKRGDHSQRLHVTILDHKPAVMARDLIFLHLLNEAVVNHDSKETALITLSFLFCSHLLPPFVWERLQKTIVDILTKLEKGETPCSWISVPVSQMATLSRILQGWVQDPTELYSTSRMRKLIAKHQAETGLKMDIGNLPECKTEHRLFDDLFVLIAPDDILSRLEPELLALLKEHQKGRSRTRNRLGDYIDKTWKLNVTLIDYDWESKKEDHNDEPDMGFDPFYLIGALTQPVSRSPILVKSIYKIQERLFVEMIVGDMADVLERIRYGHLERPSQIRNSRDAEIDWPRKYHVIHMSNIPDYIGGSLTSFLYAAPILHKGNGTGLVSCVLRNPPKWKSVNNFNAEHLLMYDRGLIQSHFSVKRSDLTPEIDNIPMPMMMGMPMDMVMTEYYLWERCHDYRLAIEKRMSRSSLTKWLHSHFLKLCLPAPRPQSHMILVYAPLNMTTFLRLLVQVSALGYPDHWISSIITTLSTGSITTTARAPRKYVLNEKSIDEEHPSRSLSVQPWVAEFTTLITIWRGLFSFGLVTPQTVSLPPPDSITEYSVTFPPFSATDLNFPHFTLVFWNRQKYGEDPPKILRPLLDDEHKTADTTSSARNIRTDGIRVLTTFKWVRATNTASFWLRSDVADVMMADAWTVFIWRVDSWVRLTAQGLSVQDTMRRQKCWTEWVTSAE